MFPLTPTLSLKGEGVVCAGIILWGSLSPKGAREKPDNGFKLLNVPGCRTMTFLTDD
jgi:hypothetical protein